MPFATAAIASALILVVGLSRGGGNPTWGGAYPSSALLGLAADSGSVREQISIPSAPSDVAVGVGSVWVTDPSAHRVLRVDPVTRVVIDRIPIGGEPGRLVVAGRAIWVTKTVGGAVARIDPSTGTVSQSVPLEGANVSAIAYGQGWLWAADATNHALVVMDPVAESPRRTIELDLTPSAVAVAPREVWVAGYDQGTVEEIDPVSRQVRATIHVGQGPSALAVYGDSVWVANSLDGTVSRIDRRTDSVEATVPVGSGPSAITASNGAIWVASRYSGTISRIDADSSQIVSTHHVDGQPVGLTVADSQIWVGSAPSTASHTGGTLTIASTDRGRSLDPAFQASSSLLTRLAYDSLVTFEAAPGPAGLRLVPDLALSLPTPSRAGTLYSFKVRPGIRYSNGDLLRARDFRRGIERLFRTSSPGASYFTELVGADACIDGPPRRCDLSHGIATDDAARTVLFRLRAPDPDFLYKLTVLGYSAPVPAGTPDRDLGSSPVPGTGPYRVTRTSGRELRFVRNGFFREWSHAAQPNGNADSIVWRSTPSADAAVGDVEQGRADWVGAVSPGRIDELARSSPAQLHRNPSFAVEFVSLNTRRRPFDDVRVRKALNYALDRAKIARMYGLSVAAPLCQPLAPGLPGYAPYCPYTVHPERDGRWSAPDSARAKRLVAASGTRGEHVDVWAASDQFFIPRRVPRYVTAVLRLLGYRAQLHRIPYARFSPSMRRGIQLSVDGDWVPDYAAPSSYLPQFFGCNGGSNRKHYFCDPRLDRRMRRASVLELADPASAAALWENIDHELVDRAVWVPTVNVGVTELVSRRLRNYQYHPVFGFLAAQAWLG